MKVHWIAGITVLSVFCLFNRSHADPPLLLHFDGEATNDFLGEAVSYVGDTNGDDFDDVIVGAPYHDGPTGTDSGKVYLFSGLDGALVHAWDGEAEGNEFGESVSGAGDANCDGWNDVLVGARLHDGPAGTWSGKAYIFSGLDGSLISEFHGEAPEDFFGESVAYIGNVDWESCADVIIGAPNHDSGGNSNSGKAYVFSGLGGLIGTLEGEAVGDNFGYSVSGAGDANGDSIDDVIVGARFHAGPAGAWSGKAYVYELAYYWPLCAFDGKAAGDWFGYSVSGAGDVNGDDFDDVIVGAPGHPQTTANGSAHVFSGQTCAPLHHFYGEAPQDRFGLSVSHIGHEEFDDVFDDVLVGAPWHDGSAGTDSGKAYRFFGDSGALFHAVDGKDAGDFLGYSVSGAGDVNNDGWRDIVLGAPGRDFNGGDDAGAAKVFGGCADADWDGVTICDGDCNDQDPNIRPGLDEVCNRIDDNCDGQIDEGLDADGDGFTPCSGDCDDTDPAVNPDAEEVHFNGVDDNCDGFPCGSLPVEGSGGDLGAIILYAATFGLIATASWTRRRRERRG